MGETPKTALHRCMNLCKVANSPSAPCSLFPVPCSLFPVPFAIAPIKQQTSTGM
ncbi:hypothetical protein [Moorena producens]|uniref:hypothetical protein n=1 Tax=Moorena producens TaxID=1155739 RepID=UPI000A762728|nr:hypothetical protein [Moorena producens]